MSSKSVKRQESYHAPAAVPVGDSGFLRLPKSTISRVETILMSGSELGITDQPNKVFRVRRSKEALDAAIKSFARAPIIVGHHDLNPDNVNHHIAGAQVGKP